jgi:hypothetical protein
MRFVSELPLASQHLRPQDKTTPPEPGSGAATTKSDKRYSTGHNTSHNRTRLPAYGRQLLALRERARVPAGMVLVSVGLWLQEQVPSGHLLVVGDDTPPERLDLSIIAGLGVVIVFDDRRLERACELVNPILAVAPTWLAVANLERRIGATIFENGTIGLWPWGWWHWHVFDGDKTLALPEAT